MAGRTTTSPGTAPADLIAAVPSGRITNGQRRPQPTGRSGTLHQMTGPPSARAPSWGPDLCSGSRSAASTATAHVAPERRAALAIPSTRLRTLPTTQFVARRFRPKRSGMLRAAVPSRTRWLVPHRWRVGAQNPRGLPADWEGPDMPHRPATPSHHEVYRHRLLDWGAAANKRVVVSGQEPRSHDKVAAPPSGPFCGARPA